MKKILSVKLKHIYDKSPDTSYLGEYSDKHADTAIIRVGPHSGTFVKDLPEDEYLPERCRENRYFHPSDSGEKEFSKNWRKAALWDFERMESLMNGNWHYIGICAEAEVQLIDSDKESWTKTIESGGVWGIESDSGKVYLAEVGREELKDLAVQLRAAGFSKRQIDKAFENSKTEEVY